MDTWLEDRPLEGGLPGRPRDAVELTVLLPCLDEAATVGRVVDAARGALRALGVRGEVLVADNGSVDGSAALAAAHGARVVHVATRGYGEAVRGGIDAAAGRYVVMADADDSYDLHDLAPFLDALRGGAALVMGDRFAGGIEPGAMSRLHRLGNPVLSFVGRRLFGVPCRDFHCGLRAFDRQAVADLDLRSSGMEFASELVVRVALAGLPIREVPTRLRPDGRDRPSHLRTWRDGWRHLRYLLVWSPSWLFLYPGMALVAVGVLGGLLATGPKSVGRVAFDVHSLLACVLAVVVGTQAIVFAAAANAFGRAQGLVAGRPVAWIERWATVERGLVVGAALVVAGAAGWAVALSRWGDTGFGDLDSRRHMRLLLPSAAGVVVGLQLVLGSFLVALARATAPRPVTAAERRGLVGLFLLLVALYGLTGAGHMASVDEEIVFQTTRALAHGRADLDVVDPAHPALYTRRSDGTVAGQYGLGPSLAALPLYVVSSAAARLVPPPGRDGLVRTTTLLTGALLTAATAAALAGLARTRFGAPYRRAWALGAVFGAGTYAWPQARTLFSEPGTALALLVAVGGVLAWHQGARPHPALTVAGGALGTAVLFRLSAGVLVAVVLAVVAGRAVVRDGVRSLLAPAGALAAGAAVPLALVLLGGWWRFGGPLRTGYAPVRTDHDVLSGVVDQLVSPGKGVLWYAPVTAVALGGVVAASRGRRFEVGLLAAVVATALVFHARLPYWAGDAAWGPCYVHLVLPLLVLALAPLLARAGWWRAVRVAGVVGLAPALLGVLVYCNVFYAQAIGALGVDPVPAEAGWGRAYVAMAQEWRWNPLRAHLRLLPDAARDVLDPAPGARPAWDPDPATHYGFFSASPRLDLWWLWVGPTGASRATYLLVVPLVAAGVAGAARSRGALTPSGTRPGRGRRPAP